MSGYFHTLGRIQYVKQFLVIGFFLAFLGVGLMLVGDYGLSYDEPSTRYRGLVNLDYIVQGDPTLLTYEYKYHGPFFTILLAGLERLLQLQDSRSIYLMRHVATFFVFYLSVIIFYLLCQRRFCNWRVALCGSLFLILSPRIFADAFYNVKDLPFLAFFIFSMYTFVTYIERPTWLRLLRHACVCGMLVDIRILGILVPVFTAGIMVGKIWYPSFVWPVRSRTALLLFGYGLLVILFVILFFPILWDDPWYHFTQAFLFMKQFPWKLDVLYLGEYINAANLPWHYLPVWIGVTTPIVYLALFAIGITTFGWSCWRKPLRTYLKNPSMIDLLCVLWLLLPILAVILLKSVVYDGWRHLFFIYPAFVLLALRGMVWLLSTIRRCSSGFTYTILYIGCLGIIGLGLIEPVSFMIAYHPYQNVYFNRLAGKDMQTVKQRFELDYWALAYTEILHYLAKHDRSPHISVVVEQFPRNYCTAMLPAEERARLTCIPNFYKAQYFVGNYRMNKDGYPCDDEVYAVKVLGVNIAVAYKTIDCRTQ